MSACTSTILYQNPVVYYSYNYNYRIFMEPPMFDNLPVLEHYRDVLESILPDHCLITSNQCYDLRSILATRYLTNVLQKAEVLKRSFSFTGMEYWNAVPSHIRNITYIYLASSAHSKIT